MAAGDSSDVEIGLMEGRDDLAQAFDCQAATFGRQTSDAIWMSSNPGWDTPQGRDVAIQHALDRWASVTRDTHGNPNTVFLKATVPSEDGDGGKGSSSDRKLVGCAIWVQHSAVPGHGEPVPDEAQRARTASLAHPHDEAEARYLTQMGVSLWRRRAEVARDKAQTSQPAFFVLDLCVVDPAYQRRGIAARLVRWGLDEAARRGGLECTTEASVMGRAVYQRLGFAPEAGAGEIVYEVDDEFRGRPGPGNVFLRTGVAGAGRDSA